MGLPWAMWWPHSTFFCLKTPRFHLHRIEWGCSLSVWSETNFKQNPKTRWEQRRKDFNPRLTGKGPTYPLVPAFSQGKAKKWDTVEQSGETLYTGKLVLSFHIPVKMYWVAELKNKHLFVSFGPGKFMLLLKEPKTNLPGNLAVYNSYGSSRSTYIIINK